MLKKITYLTVLLLLTTVLKAQQPTLKISDKDSTKVSLNSLTIDVKVVGNIAITTMEMQFCNKSNRVLEGELTFPMPEGVSINRYALDINGKMREAVPVEKEKGQVAFENTIKRKIDPGLLEKVEGNNFRTRIYPIPANGCRTVIIAYQEALFADTKNALSYNLPLQFRKPINQFKFTINVFSKNQPEIGKACNTTLQFTAGKNVYNASISEFNFKPNGSFQIKMPKLANDEDVLMQKKGNDYYFLINHFPEYKITPKKIPNTVHIIWDNSFSGANNDHQKEIDFIKEYANKIQNGTFILSTIGYTFETKNNYSITNGNCDALIDVLKKMVYDGATNLSKLQWNVNAEEHLLFSDGINTYGDFLAMQLPTKSLHTITASPSANFSNLKLMANKTGGQFINLNTMNTIKAVTQINQQPLRLINVITNQNTSEIYPSYGIVKGNMAISGISNNPITEVTLQYGVGSTVEYEEKIKLNFEEKQIAQIDLDKIWASQKINQLEEQYDLFQKTINDLGKKYNLVTRNTSLIVLDNVEDYVKYEIEPPLELKASYDSIMQKRANENKMELANNMEEAITLWKSLQNWWAMDYTPKVSGRVTEQYSNNSIAKATIKMGSKIYTTDDYGVFVINEPEGNSIEISKSGYQTFIQTIDPFIQSNYSIILSSSTPPKVAPDEVKEMFKKNIKLLKQTTNNNISGVIIDKSTGSPIPYASIFLKGSTNGTTTDNNGKFSLNITKLTTPIRISYVGYDIVETSLNKGGYYEIKLNQQNEKLEEVVVTGYATQRRRDVTGSVSADSMRRADDNDGETTVRRNVTASVTTVSAAEIRNVPNVEVEQALAGRVPGVTINANAGATYNVTTLRGNGSFTNSNAPLYIVNGVEISATEFNAMDKNGWANINVIKDANGTALYGARASNGVIVANTKDYKPTEKEKKKNESIAIKEIASNKPFIKTLREIPVSQRYEKYLELRNDFLYTPSFYFEVAKFFFAEGDKQTGLKILSTVADLNIEDHELYKMLGYQLKMEGEYEEEVNVFKKVVHWRPQEPQSYRDYGLALQDAGKYQQALDTLYTAITKKYDDDLKSSYQGIEEIIVTEINNITSLQKNILTKSINKELISTMPVDVRVVLNWNMSDTDIDLWVTDPRGERCFYSNKNTKIGGRISKDFTEGYGPEQFLLKKALKGKYKVQLHYYGDNVQKISGGCTVMAEIFTNYSSENQVRKLIAIQMEKVEVKEGVLVGEFEF